MSEDATKTANATQTNVLNGSFPTLLKEGDELVEKEIRDRFKKMCEGYFDSVSKKLVIEHNVSSLYRDVHLVNNPCRDYKSRTGKTTKPTSARVRYLRTASKRTRK